MALTRDEAQALADVENMLREMTLVTNEMAVRRIANVCATLLHSVRLHATPNQELQDTQKQIELLKRTVRSLWDAHHNRAPAPQRGPSSILEGRPVPIRPHTSQYSAINPSTDQDKTIDLDQYLESSVFDYKGT